MMTDVVGYCYAATVAVGGVIGYAKAGSMVSMIMGLIFGSLLMVGAYMTSQNNKDVMLSLVCTGILAGVMGTRFASSWKFMPAGLITLLSLLNAVRLGFVLSEAAREK